MYQDLPRLWAINKLALIICPSKMVSHSIYTYLLQSELKPLTTDVSMAAYCPSYISMAAYFSSTTCTVCTHTTHASSTYVRILRMLHQSQYVRILPSISVWPHSHTSIHLSMAAYFHPSQYGRILLTYQLGLSA